MQSHPGKVRLGNSARRIAHLTGFKPVPSSCNTQSGSGEHLLWFALGDFQAQKFCPELFFDLFIVSTGPFLRRCGWGIACREGLLLRQDPALLTGGQLQNIFLLPPSTSWSTQSQKCGSDKTVLGPAKNFSVGFVSLSSWMCQQTAGQVLTRWL